MPHAVNAKEEFTYGRINIILKASILSTTGRARLGVMPRLK
jgi:hypothetical protein